MNLKQENRYSNSNNIIQKAYDYFRLKIENKDTFSFYELPTGITKEMLYMELKCMDLSSYYETVSAEYLWKQYVYIHTSFNNKFGFTKLPIDYVIEEQKRLFKFNNINYLNNPKKTNSRSRTSKRRSSTVRRSSSKRNRKSHSGISYFIHNPKSVSNIKSKGRSNGRTITRKRLELIKQTGGFNGNSDNLRKVVTDINRRITPNWHSRYTTYVKINDINNQKIYLHASSIPMPNRIFNTALIDPKIQQQQQFCSNLLNFYRFIVDIPKIISLQGCDLDWSFLPSSYEPESCHGVNELIIWNETCSRYSQPSDEETDTNEIISDPRSNMMEFHWVDMHPGFFSVYDNLSKIDFTNKENNSVIHCLAGFGRTGIAILLVICVNYYRANKSRFNSDFFVKSKKSPEIISKTIVEHLKSLLNNFIEIDTDLPEDIGLSSSGIMDVKLSISRFNIKLISQEIFFESFMDNYGYHISYTQVNVFITRVNYIIYFTTLRNNIKQFPLFSLKSPTYFNNKTINDNDELFKYVLNEIQLYTHDNVEKIMNDADILGFDLQELPIVDGFNFETLPDVFDTSSPSSRCSIS